MFACPKMMTRKNNLRSAEDERCGIVGDCLQTQTEAPTRDGEIHEYRVADGRIATVMFRSTDRFYDCAYPRRRSMGSGSIASKCLVPSDP